MPTNYTALDLFFWHEEGSLHLSPKFQRRSVWKPAAKSYFIDTLLRGFPVPPLHIRMSEISRAQPVREVVDGQQRLRALFDFMQGKLRLSRNLDGPWAGKRFSDLDPPLQDLLRLTSFHVYQYQAIPDETVLQIFARMNTYSVGLNAQELRNGKYFGQFKKLVYDLAWEYLPFWRSAGLFSEAAIARMAEAEFVSELLVLQVDGLQDKKKSIDTYYAHLEDDWTAEPQTWMVGRSGAGDKVPVAWLTREESERRFRHTIGRIAEDVGDALTGSPFARVPLFYTLYSAMYHLEFGLPKSELLRPTSHPRDQVAIGLRSVMDELSSTLEYDENDETLRRWQRDFIIATSRQTDNLIPRRVRLETMWDRIGLES